MDTEPRFVLKDILMACQALNIFADLQPTREVICCHCPNGTGRSWKEALSLMCNALFG
jgi:hypothetical protein